MGTELWWFIGVALIPLIIIIVSISFLYKAYKRKYGRVVKDADGNILASSDTTVVMLKKKYARGEISKEEYEQMKKSITT